MKELEKSDLIKLDGGLAIKMVGLDGSGHHNIYILDLETGTLYNILGNVVYNYMGDW